MKFQTLAGVLLIGILCLTLGWLARGMAEKAEQKSELDIRNEAMMYLATEGAGAIFNKLGKFGVQPENVRFVHAGSGVQVQIEADDERAMEIAKAIQPMVPDFGPTRVTFCVEVKGGGIMIYKDRIFDMRPLYAELLEQTKPPVENPAANKP